METSVVAVIVLLGLVGLRWVLLGVGAALLLRPVRECPACFAETFGLHHRLLRHVSWLEWRWCAQCGWHGPARRIRPLRPNVRTVQRRAAARPSETNRPHP